MTDSHDQGFITDGYKRARAASEPKIRAEVEREFADRLKAASFLERMRIRRKMNKEILHRVNAQSPPDALY